MACWYSETLFINGRLLHEFYICIRKFANNMYMRVKDINATKLVMNIVLLLIDLLGEIYQFVELLTHQCVYFPINKHLMIKLQTKVFVVTMSHYSTNQHSTQTSIKPIAFKQNRINSLQTQGRFKYSRYKIVRSAIRAVKKKGAINLPERT